MELNAHEKAKIEKIADQLTRFFPAQIDYITAKAENETLHERAKARNKSLHTKARESNGEAVLKIFKKIEAKNKEIGLYKSNTILHEAEENLIKWFIQEMAEVAKATGRENEFKIVPDLMKSPTAKTLKYRRQIIDLAMRYKAPVKVIP